MCVTPSCTFYNNFLVKGTAPAKKKPICAEIKINTDLEKSFFFRNFMYIIVAVHFITFKSVIVSINTHRSCYVSKRAYSCSVREF